MVIELPSMTRVDNKELSEVIIDEKMINSSRRTRRGVGRISSQKSRLDFPNKNHKISKLKSSLCGCGWGMDHTVGYHEAILNIHG